MYKTVVAVCEYLRICRQYEQYQPLSHKRVFNQPPRCHFAIKLRLNTCFACTVSYADRDLPQYLSPCKCVMWLTPWWELRLICICYHIYILICSSSYTLRPHKATCRLSVRGACVVRVFDMCKYQKLSNRESGVTRVSMRIPTTYDWLYVKTLKISCRCTQVRSMSFHYRQPCKVTTDGSVPKF